MYIPDHDMIPPEYEPCEKKCRLCGATYAYDDFSTLLPPVCLDCEKVLLEKVYTHDLGIIFVSSSDYWMDCFYNDYCDGRSDWKEEQLKDFCTDDFDYDFAYWLRKNHRTEIENALTKEGE